MMAVATALVASAYLSVTSLPASAQGQATGCADAAQLTVLASPLAPTKGAPLRVMLVAEKPIEGELSLVAPDGKVAATARERHDGPPYYWTAEIASPAAGTWHATLMRDHAPVECTKFNHDIVVHEEKVAPPRATPGSIWPLRTSWNRATENLYSAWIEKLFDAPLDVEQSWPALHEVLRDRSRNFLFNYLGLNEDEAGLVMKPDCADLPYFLRAYFAFKLGLPFGFSQCSRGGGGTPPKCYAWMNVLSPNANPGDLAVATADASGNAPVPAPKLGLVGTFGRYIKTVGDGVQSGAGRTALNDDNNDFYPVPLSREALRPGVIYADPYGHVLMLVRRVAQTKDSAGVLLAVDAEPDGTVTRKRFWRGNFLFVHDPTLGGPGFKHFRPIVRTVNGSLRRLSNAEVAKNADYGDISLEQGKLDLEAFYDRMEDAMSPEPLDPVRAMKEAITSLQEQVRTRVVAVENGRKYVSGAPAEIFMPDGPAIFATNGAWEDFSTPARDFRLLIAIDVVRNFPDRVARLPERFQMPKDKSAAEVKAELQGVLATELAARTFSYTRSDGSPWTLSLKDVVDRARNYETAYNPNDCAEMRWGARENSDEAATCKRRAPTAQRAKMNKYQSWFRERHWPTRA
jgi:hypothetical protein